MDHYEEKLYPYTSYSQDPYEDMGYHGPHLDDYSQDHGFKKRAAVERDEDGLDSDYGFYGRPPFSHIDQPWIEDTEGENINIFVVDDGFADHADELPTFQHAFDNNQFKDWFLPRGPLAETDRRAWGLYSMGLPESEYFHGTHVISKIIDKEVGFARKANIWIAANYDRNDNAYDIYNIDLLFQVLERIDKETSRNPQFKAIINLSEVFFDHRLGDVLEEYPDDVLTKQEKRFIQAKSELLDILFSHLSKRENVIMVTGVGNGWKVSSNPSM
ncbi:hypothetical protein AA313_de0208788 [Arthrobotrys entomopaga]|nr:hypothetical protein AA313_de0208788 [Arthrobotrys entomopaga]